MRPRHAALAVAVAAVWGVNFVIIHIGLSHFPPLLFSALRFGLAAFPAILFVGKPQVRWRWVLAVGLILGVVKFSLLFAGIAAGMPAGLSSVVLQAQAVFTMVFAAVLLRERPRRAQLFGMGLALVGIAMVALRLGPGRPATAFALVLAAAVAFGLANIAVRAAAAPDQLRFMVWVSAVASPVLVGLSLSIEGPAADLAALRSIDLGAVGALAYIAWVSTLFGFGAWGLLMRRYGATSVAPYAMLVPFAGIGSAALLLGERVYATDLAGGVLVIAGLVLGSRRARRSTEAVDGDVPVVELLGGKPSQGRALRAGGTVDDEPAHVVPVA